MHKSIKEERETMEDAKKKMSRGKRIGLIAGAAAILLVAAILVYAFVITKSGYWFIAQFTPDTPEQQLSFASASDTARTIADEGFVLMQNNDSLLPLETSPDNKTKLNLFGMRSISMVYNAGGSSSSNVDSCVKLEDALRGEYGNFEVNPDLLYLNYNFYKTGKVSIQETSAPANKSASEFIEDATNKILPEVPGTAYSDTALYSDGRTLLDHAYDYSDIAMVVVGRGGGEMVDFNVSELQLLPEERDMLDAVCARFEKVILIINSANALEMDFLKDYPSIKSVVWIGYPGQTGVESLARILNGTVNPSGHLADTWLNDNLTSPAARNYLPLADDGTWDKADAFHYTNAPAQFDYRVQGDTVGHFVQYSEGVYVGYKYFETRHDTDPDYDYSADVAFPFGHGLSYTTFEKDIMAMNVENGVVTVRVEVTNTGDRAGKDVLQLYFNPPYTGAVEKSTVNLVAFKKTNLIEPGQTEHYSIEFNLEDMACYDAAVNKSYLLEKGDYIISLRSDSHTVVDSETYTLDRDIIYSDEHDGKRSTDLETATNLFDDAYGAGDYLTREWKAEARAFTGPREEDYTAPQAVLDALTWTAPTDAELGLTEADLPVYGQTLSDAIMLSDMKDVPKSDPKWDAFISQLTLEEMASLSGNGAWQINNIDRLGVPRTLTPDGSTTVTASMYAGAIMGEAGCGITYPTPVVTASSWNSDIAYLMGTSAANEAVSYGYAGWYAPSMNTHRVPFNGRNFEYYSEDGVLSASAAANVVKGATDNGIMCFMKHFAINDRETGCRSQLFTWVSEQAMREIYLRPFEAAVKEGGTLAAMSSFNYIGTTWAGGSSALLKDLLRGEWGFEGLVITDANLYGYMNPVQMIYNGGDLSLDVMAAWAGGIGHGTNILEAAQNPDTRIGATRSVYEAAKNILFAVSRTWAVK